MEAAVPVFVGIAAGLYALLSSGKKGTPTTIEPLVQRAVPIVKQQIASGIPKDVAVRAAAVAVTDLAVQQIVKANICVLLTDQMASKTNPYYISEPVVQELRKRGWVEKSTYRTMTAQQQVAAPVTAPVSTTNPWASIANANWSGIISGINQPNLKVYLCPPGIAPI